ncbi:MAG: hypothetical protein LRZ94_00880 [Candidatus Pacebacteria bacterium]|nr:hypothetical protein [Candidatus Paceibacterota bacterium]
MTYFELSKQFKKEVVEKTKSLPIQVLDTSQNFGLWLDKRSEVKIKIINKIDIDNKLKQKVQN